MQGGPGWPGSSSRQRADEAVLVGACCMARDARPAAPAQSLGSLRCCPALGCLFPSLAHLSELRFGRVPSLGLVLQVGHVGLARGTEQPRVPVLRCPSPRRSQPQTPAALLRPFVLPGLELARGSGPSCWVLGCDSPSCSRFPPSFKDAHHSPPLSRLLPSPVRGPRAVARGLCSAPSPAWPPARTNKPQGSSSAEQETRELSGLVATSDLSGARLQFRFAISPSHLCRWPWPAARSHGHGEQAWMAAGIDVAKVGDFCSKPAPAPSLAAFRELKEQNAGCRQRGSCSLRAGAAGGAGGPFPSQPRCPASPWQGGRASRAAQKAPPVPSLLN